MFHIIFLKKILSYFTELTPIQISKLEGLDELYKYWNVQINVISRKDIDFLYERHVLHSLCIAKVISFVPDTKILDVGTGGGFPGIPLAILFPEVQFHLVDSISKKISVVKAVSETLHLPNVTTQVDRAERIEGKYDFVVSRAVTRMNKFVPWIKNNISSVQRNEHSNGILSLKGGDLSNELSSFPAAKTYPISKYFFEDFFETKQIVHLPIH